MTKNKIPTDNELNDLCNKVELKLQNLIKERDDYEQMLKSIEANHHIIDGISLGELIRKVLEKYGK